MTNRHTTDFALERIKQVGPPYIHLLVADPGTAYEGSWLLNKEGLCARLMRAKHMRTFAGLYTETSAALQFPDYFGYNWAALDECLADLMWLPANGYVLLITDASQILEEEKELDNFEALVALATGAADEFSRPVELGEWWDRPALPYHLVLQEQTENVSAIEQRLNAAGIIFTRLNRTEPEG
ncbi:MAG: barstar family protein [Chloroflexia bacterium]